MAVGGPGLHRKEIWLGGCPKAHCEVQETPISGQILQKPGSGDPTSKSPHVQILCPSSFLSRPNDPHKEMEREEPKLKFRVRSRSLEAAKQSGNKSTGSRICGPAPRGASIQL